MKKFILIVLAIAVVLAVRLAASPKLAVVDARNFTRYAPPHALPNVAFADGEGHPRTLEDFNGQIVLLNIWATWCAPCRKELETLDRLQAALGDRNFVVVALSIDRGGVEAVKEFFSDIGVRHLAVEVDASTKTNAALGLFGLPTTLVVDRAGREVGRFVGAAQWDAPETVAFLKSIVDR
jgi:thiol-disulfide isomerase/thioredoxin